MTTAILAALGALGILVSGFFLGRRRPAPTPSRRPPESIEAEHRAELARSRELLAKDLKAVAAAEDAKLADIEAKRDKTKARTSLSDIRADLTGAVGRHEDDS